MCHRHHPKHCHPKRCRPRPGAEPEAHREPRPPDRVPRALLFGLGLLFCGCAFARAPAVTDPTAVVGEVPLRYADGPVVGLRAANGVLAFRGLPYRARPVRFERAAAPTPWTAPRDARRPGPACPQARQPPFTTQSEDCLSLDVWTPDPTGRRPVIVFVHAGGWTHGGTRDPRLDGTRLARRSDVVVVTVNHRLGALGWSRLDHRGGSADAVHLGLLDLTDALFWVNRHIARFGGDPGNITLAGASAGGDAVVTLMAFPPARGAFQRAIAMSGAGARIRFPNHAARVTDAVMAAAKVKDVEALRRLPIERLIAAQQAVVEGTLLGDGLFGPAVMGDRMRRLPHGALAEGASADVPLIVGTTRDEGRALLLEVPLASWLTPSRLFEALPGLFDTLGLSPDTVAETYEAALPDHSSNEQALAMVGDALFAMPAVRLAEARGDAPTWLYRFDWHPASQQEPVGAMHGIDVSALFGTRWPGVADTRPPPTLAGELWGAVGRFAWHGDPGARWPAYRPEKRAVRLFDRRSRTALDPDGQRRALWKALPFDGTAPVMLPAPPRS